MKISSHAWPFAAAAALAALALGLLVHWLAALPAVILLLFTLWFFRDPERDVPQQPGLLGQHLDTLFLVPDVVAAGEAIDRQVTELGHDLWRHAKSAGGILDVDDHIVEAPPVDQLR